MADAPVSRGWQRKGSDAPLDPQSIFDGLTGLHEDLVVLGPDALAGRDPGDHPDNLGAQVMALPGSAAAASAAIRWCAEHGIAVVAQGGRTGLAGGATSRAGELILSTARLVTVERLDASGRTATVQAGVTLQSLQDAAAPLGLTPGIDIASRGSATIGGMISTNAGGILAFRNGVMRHLVLGLEVVLPDGRVASDMTEVVKVSAGADIKQLFIGAEGALGFITRAIVKLEDVRPHRATALIGVNDTAAALTVIGRIQREPGIGLEAAEMMWRSYYCRNAELLGLDLGWLDADAAALLLIDISGADSVAATEKLETLLAEIWEETGLTGGAVAQSLDQARRFWALREESGFIYRDFVDPPSYDVSIPSALIDRYVRDLETRLAAIDPGFVPFVYGHIADGNLHIALNHSYAAVSERKSAIDGAVYEGIRAMGGSFSAEHGVGMEKRNGYLTQTAPEKLEISRQLKRLFDPGNLFNPGKVPFI